MLPQSSRFLSTESLGWCLAAGRLDKILGTCEARTASDHNFWRVCQAFVWIRTGLTSNHHDAIITPRKSSQIYSVLRRCSTNSKGERPLLSWAAHEKQPSRPSGKVRTCTSLSQSPLYGGRLDVAIVQIPRCARYLNCIALSYDTEPYQGQCGQQVLLCPPPNSQIPGNRRTVPRQQGVCQRYVYPESATFVRTRERRPKFVLP